jgi:hypothetical protein
LKTEPPRVTAIILGIMTDKEMALKIGRRFISQQVKIASLTGVIANCRTLDGREIPWPEMMREIEESPLISQTSQERIEKLDNTIALATDETQLIRALHEAIFFPQ